MRRVGRFAALLLAVTAGAVMADASVEEQRAKVHAEIAAYYLSQGNFNVALQEAQTSKDARPDLAVGYNMLGLVYMSLDESDVARQNFLQALKIEPKNPDYNNNYGWFLCQYGDVARSFDYLMLAARDPLYKTPEKAYVNAGLCARKQGDLAAAESYFQRALRRAPGLTDATMPLADLAYRKGDYAQAGAYLRDLSDAGYQTPEMLWLSVRTYRKLNMKDAADSAALQLTKNYPKSREAQLLASGKQDD